MNNSLRILLVLGIMMGGFTIAVSAGEIPNAHFPIDFSIDDGNPADMHGENGWLVAGSGIPSKISVSYTGGDSSVIIHYVAFTSLEKDTYGDVSNHYLTSEPYETVFSASKNTAGKAPIEVHINYTKDGVGYDFYQTRHQKIDHNVPHKIQSLDYKSEITLDGKMDITLKMEDKYGNTVNSLYENDPAVSGVTPEKVSFLTTSHAGSGFFDFHGIGDSKELISVPVNADGSAIAKFKVGTEAGPKYLIKIVPPKPLLEDWLTITALADAEPCDIAVSVLPNYSDPPFIPADGKSKFYLTYYLFDRYGNPSGNQTLHFKDSVTNDEFTERTNSDGQVMFTFGPFDRVSLFNIHAYAVENESVTNDQQLRFTNTTPEEMLLTANPQSMPSAEVAPDFHASIIAKVMDESGNGVPGETVWFFITNDSWTDAHVEDPFLNKKVANAEAVTDVDGEATVNFTPGRFILDRHATNFDPMALENCTVVATWGAKTRAIKLEWRNYPYLRVETEVKPVNFYPGGNVNATTVLVGDPVDVTIRLIGDGYKLQPDPIDVMLCVDRSGSMLKGNPDRMVSLMTALKLFNKEMAEGRDAVGMTSFGKKGIANIFKYGYYYWAGKDDTSSDDTVYIKTYYKGNGKDYSDYATLDLPLSTDRDAVVSTINGLVPMDATPMRGGLYLAIKEIIDGGRDNAVKAVILLSDGDYNYYGDPLARGTWSKNLAISSYTEKTKSYYKFSGLSNQNQNMSAYAANYNITIYSIAFGNGLSTDGVDTITTLATTTGGKYYHAPDAEKLAEIYTEIAGELLTEAGVDTSMDVIFENIELNNMSQANSHGILEYEYKPDISTVIQSWNSSHTIREPETINQKEYWDLHESLSFSTDDIGTIHLGQTWQAVFRLNVLQAGNINIFGEGSKISFNNGNATLDLPKTYITAVPDLNATGINFTGLQVSNLTLIGAEDGYVITDSLTMNWDLNYSGNYTTTQQLFYQTDGGIWNKFNEKKVSGPVVNLPERLQTDRLNVANLPPGKYKIRVRAIAPDAPDSVIETDGWLNIGKKDQKYIKLE